MVARQIHTLSHRSANPFVTINASCLQESILESELFGYKKGAFTGAQTDKLGLIEIANKGTFFVDEVGDMGTTIQAKLLRVLENSVFRKLGDTKEIKVDVRFIFATNKNIEKEIETNRFRKDLFYRLNTFIIKIPPLVERKDDIPLIANYFIEKFTLGGKRKIISKHAIDILVNHSWHGNVRELANALERAVLVSADREEIIADDLPYDITHTKAVIPEFKNQTLNQNKLRLDVMEKEHIEKVLKLADGNKSKAARLLGISRKKLYQVIENDLK